MSVPYYLLQVTSRPKVVSNQLWQKWYTQEHLPDLVSNNISSRATFYAEVPLDPSGALPSTRHHLALYQTDFANALETENSAKLKSTSTLFRQEGGAENISDNGDFDARNYELIQNFDPVPVGNTPSPFILTVEMHPPDEADFDKWYREEHLDLLSKMPGYRRSLRYQLGPSVNPALSKGIHDPARGIEEKDGFIPKYFTIHEIDDIGRAFTSKEAEAANVTPWTVKHIKDSKVFVARAWQLVHQEGYENDVASKSGQTNL